MTQPMKRFVPLLSAILILWLVLGFFTFQSLKHNDGNLVYALDDAYIHMAMAKNVARHGVWGVTRHGFSSTSSSLLWTLLLSLTYLVFGTSEIAPLAINIFVATLLLVSIFIMLERFAFSVKRTTVYLLALVALIPVPYLVFSGLEHLLQQVINLIFVYVVGLAVTRDISKGRLVLLYVVSCLVVMVRFEGLFLVAVAVLLLSFNRRWGFSLALILGAACPLIIHGLISLARGWYFLPSSVLLKGHTPDPGDLQQLLVFIYQGLRQLVYNIHILVVFIVLLSLLFWLLRERAWTHPSPVMVLLSLGVILIHVFFARSGYFLNRVAQIRYDSYLITLTLFVLMMVSGLERKRIPARKGGPAAVLIMLVLLAPLAEWSFGTQGFTVTATHNIYTQQYQMARFLKLFYNGEPVVANDIGAINFYADIHCIDIWGLASRDVADLILNQNYNSGELTAIARRRGARIAVVYDYPFYFENVGGIPRGWIRQGTWRIAENVVCADDTVSFYALSRAEAPVLRRNLWLFSSYLPPDVTQRGFPVRSTSEHGGE